MLKKAKWLIKEAQLRIIYMISKDCIFCKIISGGIKSEILMESENSVAFADINPVAKIHILIVPKKHIESVETITNNDGTILADMVDVARKLVIKHKISEYRLTFNGGKFQHVPHLHMHLLAGSKIEWGKL